MSKEGFNPNEPGQDNGNIFGLPFTREEALLVVIPVPWDVTTSYRPGCAAGPEVIQQASLQVDLYDLQYGNAWEKGIFMTAFPEKLAATGQKLRADAEKVIRFQEDGGKADAKAIAASLKRVNKACEEMNSAVYSLAKKTLDDGKIAAVLGGDHSTPLGLLRALAEKHDSFGILHIDAHADLRKAYEGFTYSHASIMYNALELPQISRLVQLGIRDVCEEEMQLLASDPRISQFSDYSISDALFAGKSWQQLCREIVITLPKKVYVSFDIDGLDPSLCPNTGTPVPGGLSFQQATFLLHELSRSGREIVGFDLCEVSPGTDEWDANVGARMLFKLCSMMCSSLT